MKTIFDVATELTTTEQGRLAELETAIDRGQRVFVEVGKALLEIRDSRLYRETHKTFDEYCRGRWGINRSYAYELIDNAIVVEKLSMSGIPDIDLPTAASQVRPIARLDPDVQSIAWNEATATAPNGKMTAAHVADVARRFVSPDEDDQMLDDLADDPDGYDWTDDDTIPSPRQNGKPHVTHNSGNNEWYTPAEYINAARQVLGEIDLDPASSPKANEVVQAKYFLTAEDDGLQHPWHGRLWMNPPYAKGLIEDFAGKMALHYKQGDVTEAIVLVNNATETAWFRSLISVASAVIFPGSRVRFWKENGETGDPLQGQAIIYLGDQPEHFKSRFAHFGWGAILR